MTVDDTSNPNNWIFLKKLDNCLQSQSLFYLIWRRFKPSEFRAGMVKYLLVLIVFWLTLPGIRAQQDPQFSMNMFNRMVLNPGYIAVPGAPQVTLGMRSQWVGIEGQPNTFFLSGQLPVQFLRGGLGAHILHDVIGPFSTSYMQLGYAFKMQFAETDYFLHMGINPGIYMKQFDIATLRPANELGDRVIDNLRNNNPGMQTKFNLGAGLYFYKQAQTNREYGEKFYAGLSMTNLTEPDFKSFYVTVPRQLNVMTGLRLDVRNTNIPIAVVPSLFYKTAIATVPSGNGPDGNPRMTGTAPNTGMMSQLDLNVNVHVRPIVLGASYRVLGNDAFVAILGLNLTKSLFFAYSYDQTLSGLAPVSAGSHEFILQWTLPSALRFYPPDLDTKQNPTIR